MLNNLDLLFIVCDYSVWYTESSKGGTAMNNINITIAANILKFRKKCALTQEELADKLGVTFQAVSKWETAKSAPDISFLPLMADIFGCYIDELFSREIETEIHYDHCAQLPWQDDEIIRGIVCRGKKILQVSDGITDKFTFELTGEAKSVQCECNLQVNGSVSGGCQAGNNVAVAGDLSGGCNAGNHIHIEGDLSGSCNAGNNIEVEGDLSGGCNSGYRIVSGGNITGDISAESIKVSGNVKAERIEGNIVCNSVDCDLINGNVSVKE